MGDEMMVEVERGKFVPMTGVLRGGGKAQVMTIHQQPSLNLLYGLNGRFVPKEERAIICRSFSPTSTPQPPKVRSQILLTVAELGFEEEPPFSAPFQADFLRRWGELNLLPAWEVRLNPLPAALSVAYQHENLGDGERISLSPIFRDEGGLQCCFILTRLGGEEWLTTSRWAGPGLRWGLDDRIAYWLHRRRLK